MAYWFPSSPWPLYQNEVKYPAFDMGKFLILMQIKLVFTRKVVRFVNGIFRFLNPNIKTLFILNSFLKASSLSLWKSYDFFKPRLELDFFLYQPTFILRVTFILLYLGVVYRIKYTFMTKIFKVAAVKLLLKTSLFRSTYSPRNIGSIW